MAIDHGALRFQPLLKPGWGRQGIAYGPYARVPGLTLAVSITNGHNTSQATSIGESYPRRIWRWMRGPGIDPVLGRLWALAKGPRKKGLLRRFLGWLLHTRSFFRRSDQNENLAIGFFTSEAPADPVQNGSGFIVHAAEGDNGELWARCGDRCLAAFRGMQNLRIHYIVALRERGAIYYVASRAGAHGLAALPMLRPVAIDAFNCDQVLYPGIHQSVLGQIGFRVDTRVHSVHVDVVPEFSARFGLAHTAGVSSDDGSFTGTAAIGGTWRRIPVWSREQSGPLTAGMTGYLAMLDPQVPSGLIHALVQVCQRSVSIAWRIEDEANLLLLVLGSDGQSLWHIVDGQWNIIAHNECFRVPTGTTQSLQILDDGHQIVCHLDGDQLFTACIEDDDIVTGTGIGVLETAPALGGCLEIEAHAREVLLPQSIMVAASHQRIRESMACFGDDFTGAAGSIEGRPVAGGYTSWERTVGSGSIRIDGAGIARVEASVSDPNPGRTFYTLAWNEPNFADLELDITAPGKARGEGQCCRTGVVFWQDQDNYLSISAWLDDSHRGASLSVFPKRRGFEEIYDAVWSNVGTRIDWGKRFRLRVVFDRGRFVAFLDDEPILERALEDIYPDDPPLLITRVGIAVNWEWGDDTGSIIHAFAARSDTVAGSA